jgi:chromosome segregation ATPase
MDQPTEDRLKRLEEEQRQLKEEVRQLREQRTEEIKAVRVEVASEDVVNRLKTLEQGQQELKEDTTVLKGDVTVLKDDVTVLKDDVGVLKIEMQGARADILQIRESQADLRDTLKEHGQRLSAIETKQDAHSEILDRLVDFAESHEKNMATKDDIAHVERESAKRFDKLETIMMQVLNRLPMTEGE